MILRIAAVVFATFLTAFPVRATAQSTAVFVPPAAVANGETPPVPKQLDILETDYPLGSLLAHEEGRVSLNLTINPEGRVTLAQITAGSGSDVLDGTATRIARTRWLFEPALKGGQPAIGFARVDVTWKVPLRPAYEYQMDVTLLPRDGQFVFEPAVATTSHALTASDYPRSAINAGQQGLVTIKFMILESGNVGDITIVRSARVPALDQAAVNVVKSRWLYKPATLNGRPIPTWTHANFIFQLAGTRLRMPPTLCASEPLLGKSVMMTQNGGEESIEVSQWVHVTVDGSVDDILVYTQKGWMHQSQGFIELYSRSANYPTAARQRRPPSCWFDATVVVSNR
jgi:TonB family protein